MEIIPVIDVMGEKVVHASGGVRTHYPLLQSVLTSHCEPLLVIADLLAWHPFATIYLADLDAILNPQQQVHADLYASLVTQFPDVTFWLDAGISSKERWDELQHYPTIKPIIGSETLTDIGWLSDDTVQQKSIVSLDFQQGLFLGERQLLEQPELWPDTVIAMNIDHVGTQAGPDFSLLLELQQQAPNSRIIAAGGVRSEQDLIILEQQGIRYVLIASALHDGRITQAYLNKA